MQENQSRRFFIPPWVDDLDIKPNPFRVFCHLLRRAGTDGRCNPSADSIARACHINRDTVWPALEALEKAGLIRRLPKSFGGGNNYQITPAIGGKTGVVDTPPIGGKTGVVDTPPIGGKTGVVDTPPIGGKTGVPIGGKTGVPIGGKEGPGSNPLEGIPLKESLTLGDDCASGDFVLFPEASPKATNPNQSAESIYREYPRKVAKPDALKAIAKALRTNTPEFLLERTKAYAAAIVWKDPQYVPHPAKWFNQERFNDDPAEWQQPATKPTTRPAGQYPEPPTPKIKML